MKKPVTPRASLLPRFTPHLPWAILFWRRLMKMTQQELADASGLSLSEIKWLERGRKRAPRSDTLEDVSRGMGITYHQLISVAEQRALMLLDSLRPA